jgi:hypothetical protein
MRRHVPSLIPFILSAGLAYGCGESSVDVVLRTSKEPVFIGYLVDGASWQQPTGALDSDDGLFHYNMKVHGDYEVVTVCSNLEGGFSGHEFLDSASSSNSVLSTTVIDECDAEQPSSVEVTGQMAQPGTIYVDGMPGFVSGVDSPWSFSFEIPSGARDLVAVTSGAVEISRLSLTGQLLGDAIDVASAGAPFSTTQVTVSGLSSDDTVTQSEVELVTRNGTVAVMSLLTAQSANVSYAPASILKPGDSQAFLFETGYFGGPSNNIALNRSATALMDQQTNPIGLELLPAFVVGSVNVGTTGQATWGSLPADEYDSLTLSLFPAGTRNKQQLVTASSSWIRDKAATQLTVDSDIPGYPASDSFTPGAWSFVLASGSDGILYTSGMSAN